MSLKNDAAAYGDVTTFDGQNIFLSFWFKISEWDAAWQSFGPDKGNWPTNGWLGALRVSSGDELSAATILGATEYNGFTWAPDSTWHHFAAWYPNGGGTAQQWLDGTEKSSDTFSVSSGFNANHANPLRIYGKAHTYVAEVALWTPAAALSAGEITALAGGDSPLAVHSADLVFYARLKTDLNDQVGSLTGTAEGTAALVDPADDPSVDDPPGAAAAAMSVSLGEPIIGQSIILG